MTVTPEEAPVVLERIQMALSDMGHSPESVRLVGAQIQFNPSSGVPLAAQWRAGVLAGFGDVCWRCWSAWHEDYPHGAWDGCDHPVMLSDAPS